MPRNVLCCLVLWFPFLVFTPSEVVCCANCTPSNPISLLLRADNTVHNVETILLRGVDIYCSTIEYKIPLCKVSLPYIPYTPHPNSTKLEESHFWPFLSFLLEIRTIGLMFCWERNGFVCLQFLFSCFFITLIVAHADGKRPLQGDWSVLLTRKSTCCAIFYLFLDKIDFWCSNIYLHLFGEQCLCAMYLFWWFLSGFKYLTTRKTFAVLLSLLNSLRIKNGFTCYMGRRIEKIMLATLVTLERELKKKQWPHLLHGRENRKKQWPHLENWSAPVDAEKHLLRWEAPRHSFAHTYGNMVKTVVLEWKIHNDGKTLILYGVGWCW